MYTYNCVSQWEKNCAVIVDNQISINKTIKYPTASWQTRQNFFFTWHGFLHQSSSCPTDRPTLHSFLHLMCTQPDLSFLLHPTKPAFLFHPSDITANCSGFFKAVSCSCCVGEILTALNQWMGTWIWYTCMNTCVRMNNAKSNSNFEAVPYERRSRKFAEHSHAVKIHSRHNIWQSERKSLGLDKPLVKVTA